MALLLSHPWGAAIIGLVVIDPVDDDLRTLTQNLEAAGGMVLSPDEFLASLSPEFMIDLADQELGASHPAVTSARSLLQSGQYFESLVAIRTALLNR